MEPIIVTAFWDVGRGKDCSIPRSNERYYKEFASWARIQNKMIIYTDPDSKQKIEKIRERYGLLERTTIIVMDDVFSIEAELFKQMLIVEKEGKFQRFKYYEHAMSNNAKFNYAWLMKYWCLADVARTYQGTKLLAWMDFGFNHLDKCYTKMEEFDFLWRCDVNMDKIHIFSLCDVSDITLVDSLQLQFDTFMGVFHLVPLSMAEELWSLMKGSMEALLKLECMDDDQQLLFMAYRQKPEIFEVHISDWFLPLKEFGASHLTTKNSNIEKTFKRKRITLNKNKKQKEFAKRCYERACKYYN